MDNENAMGAGVLAVQAAGPRCRGRFRGSQHPQDLLGTQG